MAVRKETVVAGASFVGMGFSLGATVFAAIWAGNWLDERLGTSPLFLLVLLVAGLFGFTKKLLWMVQPKDKRRR